MLLVLTHKVTTLHAQLQKPLALTPKAPPLDVVVQIIGVLLFLVQQLVSTTTTFQHHVQITVRIILEMQFLANLAALTKIITPLTVLFQAFKTTPPIINRNHNHHHNLKCSAINLISALTQVIRSGVSLTKPTNLFHKTKLNQEHHKPLPFNQLIKHLQLVLDF
jgi:hypothetical protein